MTRRQSAAIIRFVRKRWKLIVLKGVLPVTAVLVFIQLCYPTDRLPLFLTIDKVAVGGQPVAVAAELLDQRYKQVKTPLYFGSSDEAYRTPLASDLGIKVANKTRVENSTYPLWMRLVPTSLLWAGAVVKAPEPEYIHDAQKLKSYIQKELGTSCSVAPKNATLVVKDNKLALVRAVDGGTCQPADVEARIAAAKPQLSGAKDIRVPMKKVAPSITDDEARAFQTELEKKLKDGVSLRVGGSTVVIERAQLLGWLDFTATGDALSLSVNRDRAKPYFDKTIAPKVSRAAGVSKVSTLDFTETSRVNGAAGQALDLNKTLAGLGGYLNGAADTPVAVTMVVPPRVEYTRSYSPTDTGLSALLQQYAESHPGTYGISLVELGGRHRRAAFQDDKVFQTASTYKLFVAYGALKRVEAGTWHWGDQISGGRNLEKCLDDMIVKSDNACGEALLQKIGFRPLTDEMKAIGLSGNTTFLKDVPQTTAGDLSVFLGALQSGQLLNPDSTNRLLGMMKRNIFRQGIPAGTSHQVADKVGFLNGLLHDAAIIYGPDGPVVLTVMSDGSSWGTIADLTRQIEALRSR